jgi:ligand-binding sensor domain-containing protein
VSRHRVPHWITLALILCNVPQVILAQANFWQPTNGPWAADIYRASVNKFSNTIFAISRTKGVFRSTNSGLTWTQRNDGITDFSLESIATTSSSTVFVGTFNGAVFRSTNNGDSWFPTQMVGYSNWPITAIAIDNAGRVFATAAQNGGWVYRSTDNGYTWNSVFHANDFATALAVDSSGTLLVGLNGGGIYRSTDGGNSWSPSSLTTGNASDFLVDPTGYVFAAVDMAIYRSANKGASWQPVSTGLSGRYVFSLGLLPSGKILAGVGNSIFSSTDKGLNWNPTYKGLDPGYFTSLVSLPDGSVFASDYGTARFLKSADNGLTWSELPFSPRNIRAVVFDSNGNIFCGTGDYVSQSLVFASTNSGSTWTAILGTYMPTCAIAINNQGHIFVVGGLLGADVLSNVQFFYCSTDGGSTWNYVGVPSDEMSLVSVYTTIKADLRGNLYLGTQSAVGAGQGVWKSTDQGATWTQSINGLTNTSILSLSITASGTIFCGTNGGGIYRSTDYATSWKQINNGLINYWILSLAIDPAGNIYAGCDWGGGVFRSADNGNSWTQVGLQGFRVTSLATSTGGIVFAGTDTSGVFRSTNNATTWAAVNSGLQSYSINDLALAPDGRLYAATPEGLFKSSSPVTSVENSPNFITSDYALYQNYPNPFNPSTTIEFALPKSAFVTLRVYDLLGRQVGELVNEKLGPGTYKTQWNARLRPSDFGGQAQGLASGVYFYRLTTGDPSVYDSHESTYGLVEKTRGASSGQSFVQTKKLLLLR